MSRRNQNPDWTTEEDALLLQEIEQSKNQNWKMLSRKLNKKFKGKPKTPLDCQLRFQVLKNDSAKPWTIEEELILYISYYQNQQNCWESLKLLLPNHKNHQEFFMSNLLKYQEKMKKGEPIKTVKPSDILIQILMLKFIWDSIGLNEKIIVTNENCREFASQILPNLSEITKEKYDIYTENLIEKFINNVNKSQTNFENEEDELMHERPESPVHEPARQQYFWVPVSYGGREMFFLARIGMQ